MRKYVVILPFIGALTIITLFLTTVQPTNARWYLWECPGIEVHNVCRDGMYFALGWTCESDPRTPFASFEAKHADSGETLFSFSEELPKQQVPYPNRPSTVYYDYYVRLWQDGNRMLNPGEQVDLQTDRLYPVEDCSVLPDEPQAATAFSYQGMLSDEDVLADGLYDLQFTLWNADTGGTMVGSPVTALDVSVESGHFTVQLDFGQDAFSGSARWLAMSVRPGDSTGTYTPLNPRQELLSVPYASSLVAGAVISDAVPGPALTVNNNLGNGLEVGGGKYGIVVGSVMTDGLVIQKPGQNGLVVNSPANDGLHIDSAGDDGVEITSASDTGVHIGSAGTNGLVVDSAQVDAVHVSGAGDDGIEISGTDWGLYIPSPGTTYYALWPNTAQASGEWALYTPDKIQAGNISAMGLSLVAKVDGSGSLQSGDVVAVTGMTAALPGGLEPLPLVEQANSDNGAGVIGVVQDRMVFRAPPGPDKVNERVLQSAEGPARPGDYVSLAVYGIAYVRVSPEGSLAPGMRLTPADTAGTVRPLRTEMIQGMTVTEGTPIIGVLLEAPDAESGLAPVFVTLR